MDDRMVFDTDSDPGLQVVSLVDGTLSFSNQDDWCGSTETGFGATVVINLSRQQVCELHASLGRWLAKGKTP